MATLIVGAIVALGIGFAIRKIVKDRKANKGSCGCSCAGCFEMCHTQETGK